MKIEELNPFIRYASMHQTYYPQKENSICYDCRLFYILQGDGKLFADGQTYRIGQGTCIFLPPKTQYNFSFTQADGVKISVLNFDLTDEFSSVPKSFGTATESTFQEERVPKYIPPQEFSAPIIQQNSLQTRSPIAAIVEAFWQKTAYYKHYASANLKLTLIQLLREFNSERDYKLVEQVQAYIREKHGDAELDNGKIAEQFNYHPYHLNRLMKAQTQKTLHEYLTDYRLHVAKNYLRTTTLNITAIAEKAGFSSYTYFIKLFRERTGLTPLQYRNSKK